MLLILFLHLGDFVKLREILDSFKSDKSKFDCVTFTKMWQGEKLFDSAKEKGVIMRCGEGIFACNITKTEIFRSCVVPALKTFYQQQNSSQEIRKILTDFVERLNQVSLDENV